MNETSNTKHTMIVQYDELGWGIYKLGASFDLLIGWCKRADCESQFYEVSFKLKDGKIESYSMGIEGLLSNQVKEKLSLFCENKYQALHKQGVLLEVQS